MAMPSVPTQVTWREWLLLAGQFFTALDPLTKILSTIVAQKTLRVGASSNAHWHSIMILHHIPQQFHLAMYADFVNPVFEGLCDQNLLEKCLLGATQNRNENFNSLIWARAPKMEYATRSTIEVAVSQAMLVFNSGAPFPILERLGVSWSYLHWISGQKGSP